MLCIFFVSGSVDVARANFLGSPSQVFGRLVSLVEICRIGPLG
jgi:hypothetical protein